MSISFEKVRLSDLVDLTIGSTEPQGESKPPKEQAYAPPKLQRPPGRRGVRPRRDSFIQEEPSELKIVNGHEVEAIRKDEEIDITNNKNDRGHISNRPTSDLQKEPKGLSRRLLATLGTQDKTDVKYALGSQRGQTSISHGHRDRSTTANYHSHLSQPVPSTFATAERDTRVHVLHVNPNYLEESSSMPNILENMKHNGYSMDNLATIFPRWTKCDDLDRVVSDVIDAAGNDPFKREVGDALNIIARILRELVEAKLHTPSNSGVDVTLQTTLQNRIDSLESDVINMKNLIRDSKLSEKKQAAPALPKEALHAIKQLQAQMGEVQQKLGASQAAMEDNKACLESLYEAMKDLDGRKMERKLLDLVTQDIIERSGMNQKVDMEEFWGEVRRLREAISEVTAKQDLHRKFQMLQCDVTNKIFDLHSKLEKQQHSEASDDKLNAAMSKLEAKLKKLEQEKRPQASGTAKPFVARDLLCISCTNQVEMQDGRSVPFYECQHKTLRLSQDSSHHNAHQHPRPRPSPGFRMTPIQKLSLAKRYPMGAYSDVLPPHISVIASQYLGQDCNREGLLIFPDVYKRSFSK